MDVCETALCHYTHICLSNRNLQIQIIWMLNKWPITFGCEGDNTCTFCLAGWWYLYCHPANMSSCPGHTYDQNDYDRLRTWKSSNWHQSQHFHHDRVGNFHLQSHIKLSYDNSTASLVHSYDKPCLVAQLYRATSCSTLYEWFTVRIITIIGDLFQFILQHIYDVSTMYLRWAIIIILNDRTVTLQLIVHNYRRIIVRLITIHCTIVND